MDKLSIEYLLKEVKEIIKDTQMQLELEKKEKERQKKEQGYFGGWFGGAPKKDSYVSSEEKESIKEFFETNFKDENLNTDNVVIFLCFY